MKRLITCFAVSAMALTVAPASANPTASARTRDVIYISVASYLPSGQIGGWLEFTRTTEPGPSVDPNSLFPIVVDPNDPPEPPASAATETWTGYGYLYLCDWYAGGCSELQLTGDDAPTLTIDDLPAPGNAIDWSITGVVDGNAGPRTMSIVPVRQRHAGQPVG
jgi:hypothetical protein